MSHRQSAPASVVAVETHAPNIDSVRERGFSVEQSDLNSRLNLPDDAFDIVLSNQVIEHLYETDVFLEEVFRITKPGGSAIVSTENAASWHNIASLVIGWQPFSLTNITSKEGGVGNPLAFFSGQEGAVFAMQHHRILALRALVEVIKLHGFEITAIRGAGYYPLPAAAWEHRSPPRTFHHGCGTQTGEGVNVLLGRFTTCLAVVISIAIGSTARAATVSTLAGSGSAGINDGSAATATFLLPTGVAWAPNGDLYVADAAAQRIRVVRPNGDVRTIAGSGKLSANGLWVEGGYADGTGGGARFNEPSGVAVGPHGSIYVADTYNHCIREVTPSGRVTTFAGNASRPGDATGERRDAGFMLPRAISADRLGNLYIADPLTGIRRIGTDGFVTNIELPVSAPYGISVAPSAPMLFVTNVVGLWVVELSSLQTPNVVRVSRFFAGPRRFLTPDEMQPQPGIQLVAAEGERSIGYPFAHFSARYARRRLHRFANANRALSRYDLSGNIGHRRSSDRGCRQLRRWLCGRPVHAIAFRFTYGRRGAARRHNRGR